MSDYLIQAGPLINRSLSAAIAIIAGSFFLYSLTKDFRNRVARTFSALLAFVTITYIGDLGVTYGQDAQAIPWLTFQWIGIAFVPAVYMHLSDAILDLTGLPSRGRRRNGILFLYVMAALFLALVIGSDWVVQDEILDPAPHFQPGPGFLLFIVYFVSSFVLSMWFIIRARRRTLTQATRRRMTYLLITYAAPALAVFPFLLISGRRLASPVVFYSILIIADTILAALLTFMAYVLAFFGTLYPDRLVKAQMLQFFLRGPVVAIIVLGIVVWTPRATEILGLSTEVFVPFLTVLVILFLQWGITLIRPPVERLLIYTGDQIEIRRIQQLEARLLTGTDFRQLLETILASTCDYLQVESAFVASLSGAGPHLEQAIGLRDDFNDDLAEAAALSTDQVLGNGDLPTPADVQELEGMFVWREFWLLPLQVGSAENGDKLIGLLGIAAPDDPLDEEHQDVLYTLAKRAAQVLVDHRLQADVFAALEGLLPEMAAIQRLRGEAQYGGVEVLMTPREDLLSRPDFEEKVKAALAHYWGGPQLTDHTIRDLTVVRQEMDEQDGNPQRAVRAVLQRAIENLRPEGERSMTATEWILYNILELRFIQGRKVRDVALRLAMSEADFYRKQRVAIEAVAGIIAEMERGTLTDVDTSQADMLPDQGAG